MGWFARLFGREKQLASSDLVTNGGAAGDIPEKQQPEAMISAYGQGALHDVLQQTLAPILTELQQTNERLNMLSATLEGNNRVPEDGVNLETMKHAIEYALAHFFGLLKQRDVGITVNPAILGKTSDGNTALPFEPKIQHLLLVMNPLFPGLYSTQIILPSTFTRVDQLALLPNGVQTKSLHIDTRKSPPGFVDALRALQQNNAGNLYLGVMEPGEDGAKYKLQYFPCTGSELRNPAPGKFPDDLMLYFDTQPKPIVVQWRIPDVDDVFSSLHELENGRPDWLSNDTLPGD